MQTRLQIRSNDSTIFVGGPLSDTVSSSNSGLRGLAIYDVSQDAWSALQAGINEAVSSLYLISSSDQLQVVGNFNNLFTGTFSNTTGTVSTGLAVSNMSSSGEFLAGEMTNGTSTGSTFLAGNVASELQFGASGVVLLQCGNLGEIEGCQLSSQSTRYVQFSAFSPS